MTAVAGHTAGGAAALSAAGPAVGRPHIGDRARLMERLAGALDRRQLSNGGPLVREFEERVAALAGVGHAVATCNATVGLQLAIRAAGLTGEVIVPSLTFSATAHAVAWLGLEPVFCDVDPRTGNLDPRRVAAAVTPRTTGVIGVHLWGRPCDVTGLAEAAAGHGLTLLYDAAHALGASAGGRPVGSFGTAEVFSFHATKLVNAFEGGAVVTDDAAFARRLRALHNFGLDEDHEVRWVGTNGKMSEASAAMGLTSLEDLDAITAHNHRLHHAYRAGLAGIPGVSLIAFDERERNNHQYAVAEIDRAAAGLGPDRLLEILRESGIGARRYFSPGCHRMDPYRGSHRGGPLPHTDALAERVLALPTGIQLDPADAHGICAVIRAAVGGGAARRPDPLSRTRWPDPP